MDVRGDYRKLIQDHPELDDAEATRRMLARFGFDLSDAEDDAAEDDAAVIWLALAVSQSQLGRLDPAVAARALQVLDNDEGMDGWRYEGPVAVRRRRRGIAWVRGRLTGALVCAAKRSGEGYAPDERDALRVLARAVGQALDILEVEALRRELAGVLARAGSTGATPTAASSNP